MTDTQGESHMTAERDGDGVASSSQGMSWMSLPAGVRKKQDSILPRVLGHGPYIP